MNSFSFLFSLQCLQNWDWAALSSPVKSSSRWERRQDEVAGGLAHSASGGRLSDAVVALQLAAAQDELARLSAPAVAAAAAAAAAAATLAHTSADVPAVASATH